MVVGEIIDRLRTAISEIRRRQSGDDDIGLVVEQTRHDNDVTSISHEATHDAFHASPEIT